MTSAEMMKYFIALLVITNPLAAVPILISLTAEMSVKTQRKIALQAAFASLIILLIITWAGLPLLHFFGIDIASFKTAGGLIILMMGLSMLHSKTNTMSHTSEEQTHHANKTQSIAVVPLAIPLMAGPGAISTVIVWTQHYAGLSNHLMISSLNVAVAAVLGLALFFAAPIGRLLGPAGIKIVVRIMGMILAAIAIEMLASGLSTLFPNWVG